MSILLEKMQEDVSQVEAKYWGLIFDICNAVKANYARYISELEYSDAYTLNATIDNKNWRISLDKNFGNILFGVCINGAYILWLKLVDSEIIDSGLDVNGGISNIDVLKQVYVLV